MAWFADLAPCTYFDAGADPESGSFALTAVGWLEPDHEYPHGTTDDAMQRKLAALLWTVWSPFQCLGGHPCGFCLEPGDRYGLHRHAIPGHPNSFLNLLVPGAGRVYASPELILHYIQRHDYQPPEDFCDAVLACPPMASEAYFAALRVNGSPALREIVDELRDSMELRRRGADREPLI